MKRALLFSGGTSLLLGIACIVIGIMIGLQARALIANGVSGIAVVDNKISVVVTDTNANPRTDYYLILKLPKYPDTDLRWLRDKKVWERIQKGEKVTVFYSPDNVRNFVAGDKNSAIKLKKSSVLAVWIGYALSALGGVLLLLFLILSRSRIYGSKE